MLREYVVLIGGIPHTIQLDDETAARYGDAAVEVEPPARKSAPVPTTKARTPRNKSRSVRNTK